MNVLNFRERCGSRDRNDPILGLASRKISAAALPALNAEVLEEQVVVRLEPEPRRLASSSRRSEFRSDLRAALRICIRQFDEGGTQITIISENQVELQVCETSLGIFYLISRKCHEMS